MTKKVDELIAKFKEFKAELNKTVNSSYAPGPNATTGTSGGQGGMYRSEMDKNVVAPATMAMAEKAEAGPNPKVMSVKKPLSPKDVEDAGPSSFKITVPKDNKGATSERHPVDKSLGQDMFAMSEVIKFDKNGQWSLNKAAAPAAKATGAGSGSGNSPTKTNTETGGSSPGGASTGGVGSGLGGAGTGGAATGGASTGGAGTVTVTISGSSSTETSSGAGAKKGKGKGGEPAAPITLNISNVGGRTDAGNVASGDGPGASGSGGHAPNGFGGGGGGASPDEPKNFSTQGKDKMTKCDDLMYDIVEGLRKSAFKTLQHKIEGQGHSADSAAAITASIGRKEIGQKEMTARSKEARKADETKPINISPDPGKPNRVKSGPPAYGSMNPPSTAPQPPAGPYRRPRRMSKVDPEENINIDHPQGKAEMADGVNKDDVHNALEDGTNRQANPKLHQRDMGPGGKVHMVKDEGTNEEAASAKPHNKGKFHVMDEVEEKNSKKEDVKGKPYNGVSKAEGKNHEAAINATAPKDPKGNVRMVQHKGTGPQGNEAKGNDENKVPGRGTLTV